MEQHEAWYVVKLDTEECVITSVRQMEEEGQLKQANTEKWGPFASQAEAIARRVGLIRAGKCRPV